VSSGCRSIHNARYPFQKLLFRATTAMQVGEGDLLTAAEIDG
jgi:hypothetical protein